MSARMLLKLHSRRDAVPQCLRRFPASLQHLPIEQREPALQPWFRLQGLFGHKYGLVVANPPEGGTRVEVRVPVALSEGAVGSPGTSADIGEQRRHGSEG